MLYKSLSMCYCVYYIHTETFISFPAFFISNLSKMLKFAFTHREMTKKTKHQLISKTFVNNII